MVKSYKDLEIYVLGEELAVKIHQITLEAVIKGNLT